MIEARAITADAAGRHFAVAAFERTVAVWSVEQRRRVAQFDTCFEFGGDRMALVATESPCLVVGAYHRHGVEAYTLAGEKLWARSDLKGVQSVRALASPSHGVVVGVGRDARPLTILSADSGRTLDRLPGVREVYADDRGQCSVRILTGRVTVVSPLGTRTIGLESFPVLDAAVSADAVLISEAAGPVRCLTFDGAERWRWAPGRGVHALSVAWLSARNRWLAVTWPFENGGNMTCVGLSAGGDEITRADIGSPTAHVFARDGHLLITSEAVYDTERCRPLWALGRAE